MALLPVKNIKDWFTYDSSLVVLIDSVPYIDTEADNPQSTHIVRKGTQAGLNTIPSAARKLLEPLFTKGWNIALTQSETLRSGGTYGPTAKKAGQPKPEKSTTWTWAHGNKGDRRFRASWEDSKPDSFALLDNTGLHHVDRVGDFLEWING